METRLAVSPWSLWGHLGMRRPSPLPSPEPGERHGKVDTGLCGDQTDGFTGRREGSSGPKPTPFPPGASAGQADKGTLGPQLSQSGEGTITQVNSLRSCDVY